VAEREPHSTAYCIGGPDAFLRTRCLQRALGPWVRQMRRQSFAELKPRTPKRYDSLTKQLRFYFKRFQSEIDLSNFAQILATRGTIWNLISWNLIPPSLTGVLGKRFTTNRKLHCLVGVFVFGHSTIVDCNSKVALISPHFRKRRKSGEEKIQLKLGT
jgi:hypothetical protein